jgi:hypothetical protein
MPREDFRLLFVVLVLFALLVVWALPEPVFLDPSPWMFVPAPDWPQSTLEQFSPRFISHPEAEVLHRVGAICQPLCFLHDPRR